MYNLAIRKCTSPPLLAQSLKIFKWKFTTPLGIEPRTCWTRGRQSTIWASAASCYWREKFTNILKMKLYESWVFNRGSCIVATDIEYTHIYISKFCCSFEVCDDPDGPWLSYSPLDSRFAGSNPAGVHGFFQSVKLLNMASFGREVKPLCPFS